MAMPPDWVSQFAADFSQIISKLPTGVVYSVMLQLMSQRFGNGKAGKQPIAHAVATLTGLPPGPDLDRLVSRVLINDIKVLCLEHLWARRRGLDRMKSLIRCADVERLREMYSERRAAVFVFSHLGPPFSVGPAFISVGVPVAVFQGNLRLPLTMAGVEEFAAQLPGMEYYNVVDPNVNRAIQLKRATERLQRGGMVACAIDEQYGDVLTEAEFFGRRIKVARGPAVLTKLTGAPLIPITITWGEDCSVDFQVHDAISHPENIPPSSQEFDIAMTRKVVRFFDLFARKAPEQIRVDRIDRLVAMPTVH